VKTSALSSSPVCILIMYPMSSSPVCRKKCYVQLLSQSLLNTRLPIEPRYPYFKKGYRFTGYASWLITPNDKQLSLFQRLQPGSTYKKNHHELQSLPLNPSIRGPNLHPTTPLLQITHKTFTIISSSSFVFWDASSALPHPCNHSWSHMEMKLFWNESGHCCWAK